MNIVFVKPAEGLHIRATDGAVIPPHGMAVLRDHYIERRLAAGDLVVADELAPGSDAADTAEPAPGKKEARR